MARLGEIVRLGTTRPVLAGALIAIIGAGTGVVAWQRLGRVTRESDPVRYWQAQGRRVFSRMATAPISDTAAIQTLLEQSVAEDGESRLGERPELLPSLREVAVQYIDARFSSATAGEYLQRMEAAGYRMKTAEEFEERYGPVRRIAEYAGIESEDPRTVMGELWSFPLSMSATPSDVCIDPESVVVTVATSNHNRHFTQEMGGLLGTHLWHGGVATSCRFWMQAPVLRADVVERDGEAVAARIGLIMSYADAPRRPVVFDLFFDPATRRWWLDGVSVTNYMGSATNWPCAEF
jgi:hypothetical protein